MAQERTKAKKSRNLSKAEVCSERTNPANCTAHVCFVGVQKRQKLLELNQLLQKVAYSATFVLSSVLLRVYFRYRTYNAPRLKGGFVLVANHSS